MVRDVFRLAKENSPAIIFIDEIDAIATKRFDAQTGADREVQRILLELLNQMDGFDQTTNVKVIMATNRQDTLDPALLRPGDIVKKSGRMNKSILEQLSQPIADRIPSKTQLTHGIKMYNFPLAAYMLPRYLLSRVTQTFYQHPMRKASNRKF